MIDVGGAGGPSPLRDSTPDPGPVLDVKGRLSEPVRASLEAAFLHGLSLLHFLPQVLALGSPDGGL